MKAWWWCRSLMTDWRSRSTNWSTFVSLPLNWRTTCQGYFSKNSCAGKHILSEPYSLFLRLYLLLQTTSDLSQAVSDHLDWLNHLSERAETLHVNTTVFVQVRNQYWTVNGNAGYLPKHWIDSILVSNLIWNRSQCD